MISVSHDKDTFIRLTEKYRDICPLSDIEEWMDKPNCFLLIEDDNLGIVSYEYEGVYTVHWYFNSARGRKAIDLGKRMCALVFTDHGAQTLRGLIKKHLKASRWACRQLGFKSQGFLSYEDGEENEVLFATKDDFMKGITNG